MERVYTSLDSILLAHRLSHLPSSFLSGLSHDELDGFGEVLGIEVLRVDADEGGRGEENGNERSVPRSTRRRTGIREAKRLTEQDLLQLWRPYLPRIAGLRKRGRRW